ncbi:dethiobiotin synthase [Empedobacter falsenii]|uniref:ATP-dependent dethiobiotin synthetase BioD n=1 Tax=Empedobacter falsenii TaxID=343874 RepID=A0AAW7DG72_9FLAO|nr:dethiobiotin synthase [Empedobacter falsenii]MDM1061830.1 dethiobiotin synthase [Empedobacter falsenii]MDM1550683.1 dethiobiotin synthase [Empedobacter falsenii]
MFKQLFVTGIGTGVGKTLVSAILTEALQADYWKSIQSGDLDSSDSLLVKSLTSPELKIHQERYRLQKAASPHQSAKEEAIEINLNDFEIPKTTNSLIIEGAGGLFVPINEEDFMIDLIQQFNLPTVVVATNYLGCINHTLLTIEILKLRNITIEYFVFNGEFDEDTSRVIKNHLPSDISIIIIPKLNSINSSEVRNIAETIKHQFNI